MWWLWWCSCCYCCCWCIERPAPSMFAPGAIQNLRPERTPALTSRTSPRNLIAFQDLGPSDLEIVQATQRRSHGHWDTTVPPAKTCFSDTGDPMSRATCASQFDRSYTVCLAIRMLNASCWPPQTPYIGSATFLGGSNLGWKCGEFHEVSQKNGVLTVTSRPISSPEIKSTSAQDSPVRCNLSEGSIQQQNSSPVIIVVMSVCGPFYSLLLSFLLFPESSAPENKNMDVYISKFQGT